MKIFAYGLLAVLLSGCATTPTYDPLHAASNQVLLLNESALSKIKAGMTLQEVHEIMGQSMVIGYVSELNPSSQYKPLTIPNPYKAQEVQAASGVYYAEFYVTSVREQDDVVSDDELMPLVFQGNVLIGQGWTLLNSLRPAKPAA